MKPKKAIVPKAKTKAKSIPSDKVYLLPDGTRVIIGKSKQHPVDARDPDWLKKIKSDANNKDCVIRLSDGHELWGVSVSKLKPE